MSRIMRFIVMFLVIAMLLVGGTAAVSACDGHPPTCPCPTC